MIQVSGMDMANLQELYDHYISTKPSTGKLKSATSLLIHICKALNVSSPEEIDNEYFNEIPAALDQYYATSTHKAIQDKSMLAEMIGRYGPRDGWEKSFNHLLDDPDENLRQFSLRSLEYYAGINAPDVLEYIKRYRLNGDPVMRQVAAQLACHMLCLNRGSLIRDSLLEWHNEGDFHFVQEIAECLQRKITKLDKDISRSLEDLFSSQFSINL